MKLAPPTLDGNNKLYMAATISLVPLIGSVSSVLVWAAFIWALIRLARQDFSLETCRSIRLVAMAFAGFFIVEALSGAISFYGWRTFNEIVGNLIFLAFLPIYSRLRLSEREGVRNVIETTALGASFVTLGVVLVQVQFLGIRAEGGGGNPGPFAIACLVVFAITILASLRSIGYRRLAFGIASVAMGSSVLLTSSRSLWPGLILLPAIIAFIYRGHIRQGLVRLVSVVAVLSMLVLAGSFVLVKDRINEGIADLKAAEAGEYYSSWGTRLVMWRIGLDLLKEAPLLGYGPGNETSLMEAESKKLVDFKLSYGHFHSAPLQYAIRDGVFGVFALAALFLVPLFAAIRAPRDELGSYGLAFIVSVQVAYLLSGVFGIMLGHDILDTLFVSSMVAGLFFVFENPSLKSESNQIRLRNQSPSIRLHGQTSARLFVQRALRTWNDTVSIDVPNHRIAIRPISSEKAA